MADVIKGATISTGGDSSHRAVEYTLKYQLQPLGINWVGLAAYCYQEDPRSVEVDCHREDAPTTSDDELVARAELAHRLGLRVMLHPQLISLHGDFPIVNHGSDEEAWAQWFESYTSFVTHYARLAKTIRADYLVIGNEMAGSSQRESEWRAVVAAARQEYSGHITYAAHYWDVYSVAWWDAVDAIGVNPYFPLTGSDHPTLDQLEGAWRPIVFQLEQLSEIWDRPVLITEIGYPNMDGANYWGGWSNPFCANLQLDPQEQADLHEALLASFEGNPWWLGVFWWAWDTNPADGPYSILGSVQGKPAEDVLRRHYGGLPRQTATPMPEFVEDPGREMVVYHDALDPAWTVSGWTSVSVDFEYRDDRYRGDTAIRISVTGSQLELLPTSTANLSGYDLLEFYVKFPTGASLPLSVGLWNWSPTSHETPSLALGLPSSPYSTPAEDGWIRVRVPLAELFRAEVIRPGRQVNEFSLIFNEYCPVIPLPYRVVLIDELRFIGAASP